MDPNLKVETYTKGLKFPTSIAVIGVGDMLVTQLHDGKVYRILNGNVSHELIDLNVSVGDGRGLYGMAYEKRSDHQYVYLSFLGSSNNSDRDDFADGAKPSGNLVYRFELEHDKLTKPLLLQNTTSVPGPQHYGGPLLVQGNFLYHMIGDAGPALGHDTKAVNIDNSMSPDGTGGIIKIPLGNSSSEDDTVQSPSYSRWYYSYGVRNSFGIDMDPFTGYLWDSENGPEDSDELNLALPGFNSGWKVVQGPKYQSLDNFDTSLSADRKGFKTQFDESLSADRPMLVDLPGMGKYRDPEFTWHKTVGVTAVKFYTSDVLGEKYKNDIFVGDFNNGNLYHFDLNKNRTSLKLTAALGDKVADSPEELKSVILGTGFNGITDIKVGYDGYLYVLSHLDGTIYRIVPKCPNDLSKCHSKIS